jgi:hypothetical protein
LTAALSTLLPWCGVLAARALGAPRAMALRSYFPLALIPELSIGSFAFSPNLLLCFFWLATLGCAGWALRHAPGRFGTLIACLAAGAGAALACLSKLDGWLLAGSVLAVYLGRARAVRWKTLAPWAALGLFGILVSPLVRWWSAHGLSIRIDTQPDWAHVSGTLLRPLLFASPPFLYAGWLVGRDLFGNERRGPEDRLLQLALLLPFLPQLLLGVYSLGNAEWLTPTYLTLSLQASRSAALGTRVVRSCLGLGCAIAVLGWGWLRTDLPAVTGDLLGGYEASQDPSNDLYSWGPGRELLQDAVLMARERTGQTPIVIGPHWTVCAQADVALGGSAHVACDSVELDDYDAWSNAQSWSQPQTILFVTDSRFHAEPPTTFYGRPRTRVHDTTVERFGRAVRRISVSEFDRAEGTAQAFTTCTVRPARSISARSSEASGFGVVSNLSP